MIKCGNCGGELDEHELVAYEGWCEQCEADLYAPVHNPNYASCDLKLCELVPVALVMIAIMVAVTVWMTYG